VHNHAEQNGWGGGFHGSYFVESTNSPTPLIADNSYFRYEPASSIKVLYLLYTLRSGVSLNDSITYYWPNSSHPNPNVCPPDAVAETPQNAQQTTIGNALNWMMQESNNVMTRAFAIRWGIGSVEAMAKSLGMTNTNLRQAYIGCGFRGGVRNTLTLQDAAILYSCVDRGACLSGSNRQTFFSILVGGNPSSNPIGQVVVQEAAKLGKSGIVSQFLSEFNVRWKAGGYTFCLTNDGSCNPFKVDYSITGWMSIPFKPQARSFLFGDYVNDKMINCPSGSSSCTGLNNAGNEDLANAAEAARGTINQALASW
jgi:Beta-lactamase enzyme family